MSAILSFFKTLGEILSLLKLAWRNWQTYQENLRREEYKEGVEEKDTKKVEDSFDSPVAGKPDKIGEIEWDDEK